MKHPSLWMMYSIRLFLFKLSAIASLVSGSDDWSFLVIADWHGAEGFAIHRDNNEAYQASIEVLSHIKDNYGGELVIIPGDTNTGMWYEDIIIKRLYKKYNVSLTPNEAISFAGHNCYSITKEIFSTVGFDDVLLSVGDHEIGDNPWRKGTRAADGLPTFRRILADELNYIDDENGNRIFKYSDPIGEVPSRPFGTIYEETSYAHVHKNSLFITVDVFQVLEDDMFSRVLGVGGEGVVTGNVEGEHLAWFEKVLIQANVDDSIHHIFVQAHLPVSEPVRKINSSSMPFDKGVNSEFWKLMRKYNVDVYFAGEVHALTATKDPQSNLIQIVSRGNRFSNFIRVGNITSTGFKIEAFNEIGEKWRWNANYEKYGELDIQKDGNGVTIIKDEGALQLLNANAGPLINFEFNKDEKYPLNSRQILGLKYDNYEDHLIGESTTIRGIQSKNGLSNLGEFGRQYDAQIANLRISNDSPTGSGQVGVFDEDTRVAIGSMGPLIAGQSFSCSLQFKTRSQNSEMILVSYSAAWKSPVNKDFFLLTLKRGVPTVWINDKSYIQSASNIALSDGKWHTIFIEMPSDSCLLSDVIMMIDGDEVETQLSGIDQHIYFISTGLVTLGGFGYSSNVYGSKYFQDTQNFVGKMESFKLWMTTEDHNEAEDYNEENDDVGRIRAGKENNAFSIKAWFTLLPLTVFTFFIILKILFVSHRLATRRQEKR